MIDHTKWKKYLQIYIYMYVYIIYNTQRRSKILLVSEKLIKRERFTHGMIAISFLSFKLNTSLFFFFLFFFFHIYVKFDEQKYLLLFLAISIFFLFFPFFFFLIIILYDYFHLSKNSKQLLRKKRSKERSYRASYMYKIYILRV